MAINVSVIVPCYNERATIHLLLDALYIQSYPRAAMEIVITDGDSTDGTPDVITAWGAAHPDLSMKLVHLPQQNIPAALNAAIRASSGEIIIRLDAHSKPQPDYVERIVRALEIDLGQNVGGVWDIQPGSDSWIARSIAAAAAHPIGVGDARYRYSSQPGYVDTVPFGAFYRHLLDEVGFFDETLLTNEDYEFNTRIRQKGGQVWFDPEIKSTYYARDNLPALARQYWRYGYWKYQMLRRYPATVRWRQALPPLFIACLILLTLLSPFIILARWLLITVLGIYLLVLSLAGLQLAIRHREIRFWVGVPLAIACMHFSWGSGFLWGLIHPQKGNKG